MPPPKDTKTRIPQASLSIVVPALPRWVEESQRSSRLIKVGAIVACALLLLLVCFADTLNLSPLSIVLCAVAAGLALIVVWKQHKAVSERNGYETKLREMAVQLAEKNSSLKQLIQIDPLTDLLNRRGLEKALTIEMSRSRRKGTKCFAVLIDLDDFKQINERLGHAVGDLVLTQVANSCNQSIRPTDYASRIGGDEFIILLTDLTSKQSMLVAERIRVTITGQPLIHADEAVPCTASIGVAELPNDTCTIEEVLTLTRQALKASKSTGKNKITVSGLPKLSTVPLADKANVKFLLEGLVQGNALHTVSQPIISLDDRSVSGYELLSRGPEGPFEMPRAFFHLAQQNEVLTAVDVRCFRLALTAIEQLASAESGYHHVNIFPSTLLELSIEALEELVRPLRKGSLCVEISEQQQLGNPSCLKERVETLKRLGVRVALDDIGLMHSCLESIIVLNPDILKIHESFINGIANDTTRQAELQRLVAMSNGLELELIAEGLETEADMLIVRGMGIKRGQGFLFGQAVPLSSLPSLAGDSVT